MVILKRSKSSKEVIAKIPRQIKALKMRQKGYSYWKIGAALGVSQTTAFKDVTQVLKKLNDEGIEEARKLRTLELTRLDRMQLKLERDLKSKLFDVRQFAIDRILKIMKERRRYVPALEVPKEFHAGLTEETLIGLRESEAKVAAKIMALAGIDKEGEE